MLIILEGSDKCGKTSLAEFLCRKFHADYVKFSAPIRPPYEEYSSFLKNLDPHKNYVLDRFLYGEMIYGPMYRGKSGITLDDVWYLEMVMMSLGAVVIYCETNPQEIRRKFVECKETFTKSEDVENLLKSYRMLWTETLFNPHKFNYLKDPDYLEVFDHVKTMQQHFQYHYSPLIGPDRYIGSMNPKILFVGDEKNPNLQENMVFDSVSGRFLLRCLRKIGAIWYSGIINSSDKRHGILRDQDLYDQFGPAPVILLGEKARSRIKKGEVIPHPGYQRRFGGTRAMEDYCYLIEAALRKQGVFIA